MTTKASLPSPEEQGFTLPRVPFGHPWGKDHRAAQFWLDFHTLHALCWVYNANYPSLDFVLGEKYPVGVAKCWMYPATENADPPLNGRGYFTFGWRTRRRPDNSKRFP